MPEIRAFPIGTIGVVTLSRLAASAPCRGAEEFAHADELARSVGSSLRAALRVVRDVEQEAREKRLAVFDPEFSDLMRYADGHFTTTVTLSVSACEWALRRLDELQEPGWMAPYRVMLDAGLRGPMSRRTPAQGPEEDDGGTENDD